MTAKNQMEGDDPMEWLLFVLLGAICLLIGKNDEKKR